MFDFYKKTHDTQTLARLLQEKEKGQNFCETDYKGGYQVCLLSKNFYNKNYVKIFCNQVGRGPDLSVIIKKKYARFHKGYCLCNRLDEK